MEKIKEKGSLRSLKKSSKSDINNEKRKSKRNKDKNIEKSKKEKYSTLSSQTVIKDFKTSASRGLNSVRNTFDNLSNVRTDETLIAFKSINFYLYSD